jgi:cell division protein FtsL
LERSRELFRDYGLTLALLLAAVLIYWKTTTPALKKNERFAAAQDEMRREREALEREVRRLRAAEAGVDDPETIERFAREQNGAKGLPANEVIVGPESGDGE